MFYMQNELPQDIIDAIDKMSIEFVNAEGYITCEFSIAEEHVVAVHRYVHEKNRELPDYGMWRVMLCETCTGHNSSKPYHVDIMVIDDRPLMPK